MIDTTCNIYVIIFLGWQMEYLVSPGVRSETYAPAWTWHIVDLLPISLLYVSGGGMNCVSCDICVYHLGLCVCFPWGIPQLQTDWSLSYDHGLDYAS